jgi:Na+/H+-translocating membrane pyrophosphatase
MVGKVEYRKTIPATIADLAGDCFGSPADVFELVVAAEIMDAMILGSSLASEIRIPMRPYDTCSFPSSCMQLVSRMLDIHVKPLMLNR